MKVVKADTIEEGKSGWLLHLSDQEIWSLRALTGNVTGTGDFRTVCLDMYLGLHEAIRKESFIKDQTKLGLMLCLLQPAKTNPDWVWLDPEVGF